MREQYGYTTLLSQKNLEMSEMYLPDKEQVILATTRGQWVVGENGCTFILFEGINSIEVFSKGFQKHEMYVKYSGGSSATIMFHNKDNALYVMRRYAAWLNGVLIQGKPVVER